MIGCGFAFGANIWALNMQCWVALSACGATENSAVNGAINVVCGQTIYVKEQGKADHPSDARHGASMTRLCYHDSG